MLKEQFDRIICILKKQTGICFSKNLSKKMLDNFIKNKGWLYRWTTPDNLPWKFAESNSAQILNGQFVELNSELGVTLSQKYNVSKSEKAEDKIQIPVNNKNVGLLKFVFEDFKHELTNNDQHIDETIRLVIFDGAKNNIFNRTLNIDADYLINLIRKTENEKYRNKDLLEYAEQKLEAIK